MLLAFGAWAGVAYVFTSFDPSADSTMLLVGALLLGSAVGLTLAPLLWVGNFARNRGIAYRGDWGRATRRAALVGLVIVLFVLLRAQDALTMPVAAFIVTMAVMVEVTLSLRRGRTVTICRGAQLDRGTEPAATRARGTCVERRHRPC